MNRHLRKVLALVIAIAMLVPMTAFADNDMPIFKQKTLKNVVVDIGGDQAIDLTGLDINLVGAGDIGLEKLMAGLTIDTPAESSSSLLFEINRDKMYALIANQLLKLNYADIGKIVKNVTGETIPEEDIAEATNGIAQLFDILNGNAEIPDSMGEGLASALSFSLKYSKKFDEIAASVPTEEENAIFTINGEEYIGVKKTMTIDAAKFSEMMQAVSDMYQDEAIVDALSGFFSSMNLTDDEGNPVDFVAIYKNIVSSLAKIEMPEGMTVISYEMKDGDDFAQSVFVERAEMDMSAYYAAAMEALPISETDATEMQTVFDKMSKMSFDVNSSLIGEMDDDGQMIDEVKFLEMNQNFYFGDSENAFESINILVNLTDDDNGVINGKWSVNLEPEMTGDEENHSIDMELNYNFGETEAADAETKTGDGTFTVTVDGEEAFAMGLTHSTTENDANEQTNAEMTITVEGETHTLFNIAVDCEHSEDDAADSESHIADFNIRVLDDMYGMTGTIETLTRPATAADFISANDAAATDLVTLETSEDIENFSLNIQMGMYELLGGLMQVPGIAQYMTIAESEITME